MKISACIITFNEQKNISRAINSVKWADEILVVDSESTDRTREIASALGAKVIVQKWLGFGAQKQFAVEKASNDWILSLDADEEISTKLQEEILFLKSGGPSADAYRISRRAIYMNRPIRHCGWYPDWQIRLFNRNKGRWKDVIIHESVEMQPNSSVKKLRGDILHYTVESLADHSRMTTERYAPLAAKQMFENGRKTSILKIVTVGPTAFIRTYFLKFGFLDGFPGFCISYFAAYNATLKHMLLWELQNSRHLNSE